MPRTKGSKNKPKTVTADFATQIAEKQSAKEALTAEIASITANIDTLKADLKEKKTALKKTEKEVVSLEAKKAKADAKAAEEAKKTEAEAVLKKLLASGMSADEILEKLPSLLLLSEAETEEMYDLAARSRHTVSADLPEYIMEKDIVRAALRTAKKHNVTDKQWEDFIRRITKESD